MRFLFALALTSLVLFESIEVATPGHGTSPESVAGSQERGASCEATGVGHDLVAGGALACRAGSETRLFGDGLPAVAD
jgi:hypothetical protein